MAVNIEEILSLPVDERLELVSAIWDSIPNDPESVPLSARQRQMLDERLEDLKKNPEAGSSWSEVRARILASR